MTDPIKYLQNKYPGWIFFQSSANCLYGSRRCRLDQGALDFGLAATIAGDSLDQIEKQADLQAEILARYERSLL